MYGIAAMDGLDQSMRISRAIWLSGRWPSRAFFIVAVVMSGYLQFSTLLYLSTVVVTVPVSRFAVVISYVLRRVLLTTHLRDVVMNTCSTRDTPAHMRAVFM